MRRRFDYTEVKRKEVVEKKKIGIKRLVPFQPNIPNNYDTDSTSHKDKSKVHPENVLMQCQEQKLSSAKENNS